VAILIIALSLVEARPKLVEVPTFIGHRIIGGTDAAPREFPWQISQERLGSTWSHSCGGSLLSATRTLSAAHCVDGAQPNILRCVAGLHDRSQVGGAQISNVVSYVMHPSYNDAANTVTYNDDIAVLHVDNAFVVGAGVELATLPADNSNTYAGETVVISGWGRNSNSQTLPNVLQKAPIGVLSTADCQAIFLNPGTIVWDHQICLLDAATTTGACNGDSGGPANYNDGTTTFVVGITSWGTSLLGNCVQNRPSVYTRTSGYLDWINQN